MVIIARYDVILDQSERAHLGYNHLSNYTKPARGDYNTEALSFKMAAAGFFDVFEEKQIK